MSKLELKVDCELTTELLGTAPANPDLLRDFVQSRRPEDAEADDEDEAATLPTLEEELQKSTTVFHRTADGKPFLFDYQIKGFLKEACGALRRCEGTVSEGITAYKERIDKLIFVFPRRIPLELPEDGRIIFKARPLRAQTPKGERVTLVRSEEAPPGTRLSFELHALDDRLFEAIEEWLTYGNLNGLGQWRNASHGRFTYALQVVEGTPKQAAKKAPTKGSRRA